MSNKMRISQVMLTVGFGGAERLFVDLCQSLAAAGHEVQAVCHPHFQRMDLLSHERVTIAHLKASWDWSPLSRYRLRKIFTAFQPQVVHTHLARGAAIAGDAATALGIPVAANMHDYAKMKYYRNIDHFFPGTEDQRQYLIGNGIKPEMITVVPHFTNVTTVAEIDRRPDNPPTLIAYGRFVQNKGFQVLIKSVGQLHARGIKLRLLLGGDGPEKENLQALIRSLGLEEVVTLAGWVDNVSEFLDRGNYFILPSLHEPFGIVILEAMARGKTIISTTVQGPVEILDQETAYLARPDDPDSMAAALAAALEDQGEAERRAVNALAKFRRCYDPSVIIPFYLQCFERMLTAKKAAGARG